MQSVEDVHLAIEAAGLGKLVIATFAGADIATAVRRLLDLGAEPVSLGERAHARRRSARRAHELPELLGGRASRRSRT